MTDPEDSAFPHSDRTDWTHYGLTKREYFAAMAVQGYCANPSERAPWTSDEAVARWAVHVADALLDVLNEEKS